MKLVKWSTKKLESFKNQLPFSQLNEPVNQETSLEEVRAGTDRSKEQRSELDKSSSVLVVTDSLSDQTNLAPGQISLTSVPSREKLDFVPPTHPSISPNFGRLSPSPLPPSPGWERIFGDYSGEDLLLPQPPPTSSTPFVTPTTSPTKNSLSALNRASLNPFPPPRPHSAPSSPTLSRSIVPIFPIQQQRTLSIPLEQAFPKLTRKFVPAIGLSGRLSSSRRTLSLSWDNYRSDPNFFKKGSKISLVSTASESLDSSSPIRLLAAYTPEINIIPPSPLLELSDSPRASSTMSSNADLLSRNKSLLNAKNAVDVRIDSFPVQLMTMDRLSSYQADLASIKEKFFELSELVLCYSMENFSTSDPLPKNNNGQELTPQYWKEVQSNLQQKMINHEVQIREKASNLAANKSLTEFEKQSLDIQRRQLSLQESKENKAEQSEKEKSSAVAESKYDEVLAISSELEDSLDQVSDWSKASRAEIMSAMQKIEKWADKFQSMNKAYREYNLATSKHKRADLGEKVEQVIEELTEKYNKVVKEVREQDKNRELYSLAGSNSEQVKLPKFSGSPGEDFFSFKNKLYLAFEKNRVPVEDKVEKLRSSLSGEALSLVPEKTINFAAAIEVLEKAYGNSERVLQVRMDEIRRLGKCPAEIVNDKRNFSAVVSYCLKVEVLIQDILDLAEKEGCEDLKYDAYSSSVRLSIQQLFSLKEEKKMRALSGRGRKGLLDHLDHVVKIRTDAQSMVDPAGVKSFQNTERDSKKSGKPEHNGKPSGLVNFSKATKHEECRVCGVLESDGKTADLYDGHTINFVTGCPQFQAMTVEERRDVCIRAKLCLKCTDPKIVHSQRHRFECKVSKKEKLWYTCTQHPACLMHFCLCGYHKQENKSKMEEFSKKKNLKPPLNTNVAGTVHDVKEAMQHDQGVKGLKNMKRNLKKKGREVVEIPEGNSIFMLAPLKGVTRPVIGFFDSGCSDAVFRHGVPGTELHGVCTDPGPIPMTGVGGVVVYAKQEWIVRALRKDGRIQLIKGFTMDQCTAPMPKFNTEQAVKEIKSSDLTNLELQNCKVPVEVGGVVDVIIGSKYTSASPTHIHSLPSGFSIYAMQLETHEPGLNAVIGGPHKTFTLMVNQMGGITEVRNFIHCLQVTINNFKMHGPPKIPHISSKDVEYVKETFADEFELEDPDFELFEEVSESEENFCSNNTVLDPLIDITVADLPCQCTACFHSYLADDKLTDIKYWIRQMEGGLSVEYRCPACRDCIKCKNSDTTEKVSLREEVEQRQIVDNVELDLENQRIVVKLPKKGPDEQFLTSNRDVALKVYNRICSKASKSDQVKEEIKKAFDKFFDNDHAVYLKDMDADDLEKFVNKTVQYFLPWGLVYKSDSLTTPCRPVFNASSNTRRRSDGTGGRSLNDLLCKGKVDTLNLLQMVIRFMTGAFALTGDLQQFYCSFKLLPEDLNLLRFLYSPDLSHEVEPEDAVFKAMIFGVISASALSEQGKALTANHCRSEFPAVATLIDKSYVDDLGESKASLEEVKQLQADADKVFKEVGLTVKDWNRSGKKPSEISSADGASIGVGGLLFYPEIDTVMVKIGFLHFGKRKRGKLDEKTEFFIASDDYTEDKKKLDKFCPKLTRRICASKAASYFDITGLLAPVMAGVKCLLRDTVQATSDWDDKIPDNLRDKWLETFLRIEKLRGIGFERPVMPSNAVNSKLRLIKASDAAKHATMVGVWGGFLLPSGKYSCRLIIGRSLLSADTTIPRLELDAANSVANLGWFVDLALKDWETSSIQICDSTIALCWITSEQLRLSQFHRNRVVSIRRALELKDLYYVRTDQNPADSGTRPDKVSVEDILVGSMWHSGAKWMSEPLERAIGDGVIKPAVELRLNEEDENDYLEGMMFDKVPELLTRGHVINDYRLTEIEKRAKFSKYLVQPTRWGLKKFIKVMNRVFIFLLKCRKDKPFSGPLLSQPLSKVPALLTIAVEPSDKEPLDLDQMHLAERARRLLGTYLFRLTSLEVKQFNKASLIEKHGVEQNGIILSKNRLLENMEFNKVTGMEMISLDPLGINIKVPLLDRFSPLSYSIAQYVHWEVCNHAAMETCNRACLERVHILQGFSLMRELAKECITCKIKRKKFLEMAIGPTGEHQLTIAPPMYACQADIFGPIYVFVPGFSSSRDLRGRPAEQVKVWVMTFVCPVTRLVSCQVIETSDNSGMMSGMIRLGADYGWPKYLMVDKDSALLKALYSAEVSLRDLQHALHYEHGVIFSTCPVGGHNQHGHVERVIKSVQEMLEDTGIKTKRLTATGLQTLLKLVENNYNSLPLGYSYDRSVDNTPLFKIITPNFFKMGRNNQRALEGPVRLPTHGGEMLEKVYEMYDAMFKLWANTYVPRLIYRPSKWNKGDDELHIGDLVYFQKSPDKKVSSTWIIGMVEQLPVGRDGKVRKVLIKYQNHGETQPRITERAIRTLVKIYDVEEYILQEDLQELLNRVAGDETVEDSNEEENSNLGRAEGQECGVTDCLHKYDSPQVYSDPQMLHSNSFHSVSGLWLQHPVCQVYESTITKEEFKEKWADRCQQTYSECSMLSKATAARIITSFGLAVDNLMPSIKFLPPHFVDTVQPEVTLSESCPVGLIQMMKKTNIKF